MQLLGQNFINLIIKAPLHLLALALPPQGVMESLRDSIILNHADYLLELYLELISWYFKL
jgi:hypothetical protein